MLSFWEKNSFQHYDFIVLGAGVTGLSCALAIKKFFKKSKIAILEKGIFPSGASTKNAGFACFGSFTELLDDYKQIGKDKTLKLVENRVRGLEILTKLLSKKNIGLENGGGHELIFKQDKHLLSHLPQINKDLKDIFPKNTFYDRSEELSGFGFKGIKKLIYTPYEAQIDTGKMMMNLIEKVSSKGIFIYTGTEIEKYADEGDHVVLSLSNGYEFTCNRMAICTNAFTNKLVPGLDLKPGRGLVVITKPVKKLKFKGSFHFDRGYYYFRNYKDRVIFGGGRNLDEKEEESTADKINQKIYQTLEQKLKDHIVPKGKTEIDYAWTGIMAFGKSKTPIIDKISQNVGIAVRLGGMGVALGALSGQKIAALLTDQ